MRWLYHIVPVGDAVGVRYAPRSLATEGFVHASYRDAVTESARMHFPAGAALRVLQIDPRRLDAPVEEAATPRGPMPHILGAVPAEAIAAVLPLEAIAAAPDLVEEER
jgi:glutathione S-transferase